MSAYIIRRLLQALLVVIMVSFLVFILVRSLPGDPIEMVVTAGTAAAYSPEMIDALRAYHGLDRPVLVQYANWMSRVIRGDLGRSLIQHYDISTEIQSRIVVTLTIGLTAFFLSATIGPALGIISAIRRGKLIDNIVTILANIGVTAPVFWVAILLVYVFSLRLRVLPLFGFTLPWVDFGASVRHGIMPVIVTALGPIAIIARQTRSSVLEVLSQDYIRTAWAKGGTERRVVYRHVIKNSLMPVVTLQGTMLRLVVGGSVVVERIFVIPGMGKMMVDGMLSRDYPVVQATALVMTIVVVLSSLIVDLLYVWIDPRIHYS